jgi:cell division protein FtsW
MSIVTQTFVQRVRLNFDFNFLASLTTILCLFGAMMVTSASSVVSVAEHGSAWGMAQRQIAAMVIGAIGLYIFSRMSMKVLQRLAIPIATVSIAGLVLVLLIGNEVGGQKNWIDLGFANLKVQPSELGKLGLVLISAFILANGIKYGWNDILKIIAVVIVSAIFLVLVLLEKDLGTPMILAGIMLGVLSLSGMRKRSLFAAACAGIVAIVGYSFVGPSYRLDRFYAWLTPESGSGTYGYQISHGQYALADGGIFGNGLGQSSEKWGALPAAHTDFILSIVGEELGLFGTMGVMFFLMAIIWSGFRIAEKATNDFGRIAAFGITTWIAVQTIINVGAIVRFLPITGVTLPFVSYGGSSLIPAMCGIGILLAVARETSKQANTLRNQFEEVNE